MDRAWLAQELSTVGLRGARRSEGERRREAAVVSFGSRGAAGMGGLSEGKAPEGSGSIEFALVSDPEGQENLAPTPLDAPSR